MDNLENLYKKSFEDFERSPKADFWERLAPIIPPKPQHDNAKLWLFLAYCAGLLSMLVLVLGYQFFIEQKSNTFLSALPIPIVESSKELPRFSTQKIETPEFIEPIASASSINRQLATPSKSNQIIEFPAASENDINTIDLAERIIESDRAPISESKVIVEFAPKKRPARELGLPFLTKHNYPNFHKDRILFSTSKKPRKRRKKRLNDGIEYAFLAAQYTPISKGIIKIEDYTNGTTFSQNVNVDRIRGYDVSVGIQLRSNWVIQTGFTLQDYTLKRSHRQPIVSNYTNAMPLEQGVVQEYTFAGQPIIEPIQEKVEVWSSLAELQEGAIFLVQSTTQQRLKLSGFYSQFGYRFRLSPRWQFIPKLGFGALWGEKGKVKLTNINLLDTRQKLLSSSIANTNITSFNLIEGLVSTELVYRYSKRVSFTGTPHFRFGFKPFFNNYQRSTKYRFGQLQLGIRIHLL